METFKDIKGHNGYKVSNYGRVKSVKFNKEIILKKRITKFGYIRAALSTKGIYKNMLVHRLVAIAFIPNKNNKPEVNHKDMNKSNNHVNNLEWMTKSENQKHSVDNGRNSKGRKIIGINIITKELVRYDKIKIAADDLGLCRRAIGHNLTGASKSSGGYIWKYI